MGLRQCCISPPRWLRHSPETILVVGWEVSITELFWLEIPIVITRFVEILEVMIMTPSKHALIPHILLPQYFIRRITEHNDQQSSIFLQQKLKQSAVASSTGFDQAQSGVAPSSNLPREEITRLVIEYSLELMSNRFGRQSFINFSIVVIGQFKLT